jgi:dipeptidyl aminopeptidase/acylaminoacyl peptidase
MDPWLIGCLVVVGSLLAVAVAALVLIDVGFRPDRVPPGTLPSDLGMNYAAVTLTAVNGKRLAAWYIPAPDGFARPSPAVAVVHGWGSNSAQLLPVVAPLNAAGYALLMVDSRCHGGSDHDTFASMPRFAEDLSAAVDWLRTEPEIDRDHIAIAGHSLGACAALLLASRRADLSGVVAISAFADPESTMRRVMERVRVPYRPIGWVVNRYVEWRIGWRYRDIAARNTIRRAQAPVLLLHGEDDRMVPVSDAYAIHANRRTDEDVSLIVYTRCDHDSVERIEAAAPHILAFLSRITGGGPLRHPPVRQAEPAE